MADAVAAGKDRNWSDFHPGDYPMTAASFMLCHWMWLQHKTTAKKLKDEKMLKI